MKIIIEDANSIEELDDAIRLLQFRKQQVMKARKVAAPAPFLQPSPKAKSWGEAVSVPMARLPALSVPVVAQPQTGPWKYDPTDSTAPRVGPWKYDPMPSPARKQTKLMAKLGVIPLAREAVSMDGPLFSAPSETEEQDEISESIAIDEACAYELRRADWERRNPEP